MKVLHTKIMSLQFERNKHHLLV